MFIHKTLIYLLPFVASLGIVCGAISTYAVVKKLSFLGDIMSHTAFPGIAIAFLFFPQLSLFGLLVGGAFSALLSALCIFFLQKNTYTPKDTLLALILSLFFSAGLVLLGIIQKRQIVGQSILNNFLFGSLFTLNANDAFIGALVCVVMCIIIIMSLRIQCALSFDESYARVTIKHAQLWEIFLLVCMIITIIIGLHAVGILLMGTLMIAPGSFGKLWGTSYRSMMILAMLAGVGSCVGGTLLSVAFPSYPTGPLIVLIATGVCIVSAIYKRLFRLTGGPS